MSKRRFDVLLVEKGLVESRQKAQSLIMAGDVLLNNQIITKPGCLVNNESSVTLKQKPPFVSRGGVKLAHCLDEFGLDVSSKVVVDVGASTGGFTDCLLQRGAQKVYALDVGYGQLDYRLRIDPRVVVMDRTNAHYPITLPEKVDLATIDVSFISVEKVIPNVTPYLTEYGHLLVLLKPQFAANKSEVGKGGVIKDPLVHAKVIGRFICWAIEHHLRLYGLTPSPLLGPAGNREFLVMLHQRV